MLQPYWQYPCWQGAADRFPRNRLKAGCGAPAAGTGAAADPGSQAGASQPGTSQSGTSQAGTSQAGTSQTDASQSAGAEGASITFWHSMGGVNGEALEYLVNKFNSENTMGIQVEAQYQGEYGDAINILKSAQFGNMGTDGIKHRLNLTSLRIIL